MLLVFSNVHSVNYSQSSVGVYLNINLFSKHNKLLKKICVQILNPNYNKISITLIY